MPTVFPHMGSIGYSAGHGYRQVMRHYDNGAYRRYRRSTFNHKELVLNFEGVKESVKNDVVTFFNARMAAASSDFEFYVYNPEEVSTVDGSGQSATGRHLAIFADDELQVTRDGKCRWSFTIRMKLLN